MSWTKCYFPWIYFSVILPRLISQTPDFSNSFLFPCEVHKIGISLHVHCTTVESWLFGCILLGLFWIFLFRFRNNRIHGISVSKRTLIHSENGILMAEVTWELLRLPTGSQVTDAGSRVGFPATKFPKRTRILPIPCRSYSVHSAIGSRMNGMIFRSFRKRNSSQKNMNTVYSE